MAFRKRTLRTMSPTARRVARLVGEIESAAIRLKNLVPELQSLDIDSAALKKAETRYPLKDTDLWGLRDALQHSLEDGYLKENEAWARNMLERINRLRHPVFEER